MTPSTALRSRPLRHLLSAGLGLAVLLPILLAGAADLHSYAFVNDDGTLRIRNQTIHLYGIHIPPSGRTCRTFIKPIECGSRAALALDFKIGSDFVRCNHRWRNQDGSYTSVCEANGVDLAHYLLSHGWAMALPDAPFEYQAQERIARHQNRGVWGFQVDSIQPQR